MTPLSEQQLLPTKPLLILAWLLSKSQRQIRARSTRVAVVLSPFPHGLSAKAQQPRECSVPEAAAGRGHCQPCLWHRWLSQDSQEGHWGHSGTAGQLCSPCRGVDTEPFAEPVRSANTSSLPVPAPGQGTQTKPSSTEVLVPFAP